MTVGHLSWSYCLSFHHLHHFLKMLQARGILSLSCAAARLASQCRFEGMCSAYKEPQCSGPSWNVIPLLLDRTTVPLPPMLAALLPKRGESRRPRKEPSMLAGILGDHWEVLPTQESRP